MKKFASYLAHHSTPLLMVAAPLAILAGLGQKLGHHPALVALDWIATGILAFLIVLMFTHEGKLCQRCVGEMPLNGPELAERHRRSLRAAHWINAHLGRLLLGYVMFALLTHLVERIGGPFVIVAALASFALQCVTIAPLFASFRHHKLMLWCPWCRRGGGGDDDGEFPEPPPGPTHGKEAPRSTPAPAPASTAA